MTKKKAALRDLEFQAQWNDLSQLSVKWENQNEWNVDTWIGGEGGKGRHHCFLSYFVEKSRTDSDLCHSVIFHIMSRK